jgi:transcriptional regulator with XRE-family HTH domain
VLDECKNNLYIPYGGAIMTKRSVRQDVKELRKRRKALGVTQAQLAKMSRVNANTLAQYEAGYAPLNADAARQLWDALDRIESSRRSEVSLAERKLQDRVTELEKENTALRGVRSAESYAQLCSKLPWMKSHLASALEQLAQVKARAAQLSEQANLDDPIIKGLLDSLYQEKEGLEKQVSEMQAAEPVMRDISAIAWMRFCESVSRGEQWAVEMLEHYKATGEVPKLVIDSIEKVEEK